MTFTTGNKNIVLLVNFINKPVFVGYAARPVTRLVELECFWFSYSLIWSSLDAFQKLDNFLEYFICRKSPNYKSRQKHRYQS